MQDEDSRMEFYRQVFGGSWMTQAVSVAAELGIADLLAQGPRSIEELAKQTGAKSDPLYRVLRALAEAGLFAEDSGQRFALCPLGDLLRSDAPGSQRSLAMMMGGEFAGAWGELLHNVRTGEPGFHKRFGATFFEYMTEHPQRHAAYDAAMTSVHGRETEPMLDACDFGMFKTVVDIGGGNGLLLAALVKRYPDTQGILFDLPAVADRARATIRASGVGDRIRVEEGDFFKSVPAGADAYVLRHIIHDWEDAEAIEILRRCRDAMAAEGRVLVVEMVLAPGNERSFGKWLDLMMLVVAGRERTRQDYERLFSSAGLRMSRIIKTTSDVSLVEGVRA